MELCGKYEVKVETKPTQKGFLVIFRYLKTTQIPCCGFSPGKKLSKNSSAWDLSTFFCARLKFKACQKSFPKLFNDH
jgi:hypothetical protein